MIGFSDKITILSLLIFLFFSGCTTIADNIVLQDAASIPDGSPMVIEEIVRGDLHYLRYVDPIYGVEFLTGDLELLIQDYHVPAGQKMIQWEGRSPEEFVQSIDFYRTFLFTKYPVEMIRGELKRIYLPKTAHTVDRLVYPNNDASRADPINDQLLMNSYSSEGHSKNRIFEHFSHEFFHLVTLCFDGYDEFIEEWKALYPDDFPFDLWNNPAVYDKYSDEIRLKKGFVSTYSLFNTSEDLAEFSSFILDDAELFAEVMQYEPIRQKYDLLIGLLSSQYPEMTAEKMAEIRDIDWSLKSQASFDRPNPDYEVNRIETSSTEPKGVLGFWNFNGTGTNEIIQSDDLLCRKMTENGYLMNEPYENGQFQMLSETTFDHIYNYQYRDALVSAAGVDVPDLDPFQFSLAFSFMFKESPDYGISRTYTYYPSEKSKVNLHWYQKECYAENWGNLSEKEQAAASYEEQQLVIEELIQARKRELGIQSWDRQYLHLVNLGFDSGFFSIELQETSNGVYEMVFVLDKGIEIIETGISLAPVEWHDVMISVNRTDNTLSCLVGDEARTFTLKPLEGNNLYGAYLNHRFIFFYGGAWEASIDWIGIINGSMDVGSILTDFVPYIQ